MLAPSDGSDVLRLRGRAGKRKEVQSAAIEGEDSMREWERGWAEVEDHLG